MQFVVEVGVYGVGCNMFCFCYGGVFFEVGECYGEVCVLVVDVVEVVVFEIDEQFYGVQCNWICVVGYEVGCFVLLSGVFEFIQQFGVQCFYVGMLDILYCGVVKWSQVGLFGLVVFFVFD